MIKTLYLNLMLLVSIAMIHPAHTLYSKESVHKSPSKHLDGSKHKKGKKGLLTNEPLTYYLYVSDFIESFIEIPTFTVTDPSSTLSSTYLAGRAPVYQADNNQKVGTCSASFLCIENNEGIYTDIANFISVDSGLIVTWFTPTTLVNLELDSIVHSMVTECIVTASTNVGFNPFYGQTFNLIVSSENGRIYFQFTRTGTIF